MLEAELCWKEASNPRLRETDYPGVVEKAEWIAARKGLVPPELDPCTASEGWFGVERHLILMTPHSPKLNLN